MRAAAGGPDTASVLETLSSLPHPVQPGAKIASTLEDASPEEVLAMGMIAPADLERKQRKGMKAAAAAEELEGDGVCSRSPPRGWFARGPCLQGQSRPESE